jgi:hypothetical protein
MIDFRHLEGDSIRKRLLLFVRNGDTVLHARNNDMQRRGRTAHKVPEAYLLSMQLSRAQAGCGSKQGGSVWQGIYPHSTREHLIK